MPYSLVAVVSVSAEPLHMARLQRETMEHNYSVRLQGQRDSLALRIGLQALFP